MDAFSDDPSILAALDDNPAKVKLLEWLLTAKSERHPRTMEELANEVGVSRRTLFLWKNQERFVAVWRREAAKLVGGIERTQEIIDQLALDAVDPNNKPSERVQAAKAYLAVTNAITPDDAPRENPLAGMSLEELEREYTQRLQVELARRGSKVTTLADEVRAAFDGVEG